MGRGAVEGVWDSSTIKNIKSNLNIKIPGLGTENGMEKNAYVQILCVRSVACARANFISHFAMLFKYINNVRIHATLLHIFKFHVRYACEWHVYREKRGLFVVHEQKKK